MAESATLSVSSAASAYEAIPVDDPRSISAWAIKHADGSIIGAAWVDQVEDKQLFHVRFTNGIFGKAKVLKSIIPSGAWITVPLDIAPAAAYLQRWVGLQMYEPVWTDGKIQIPLQKTT